MLNTNLNNQMLKLNSEISYSKKAYKKREKQIRPMYSQAIKFVELYIQAFIDRRELLLSGRSISSFYMTDYVYYLLKNQAMYSANVILGYSLKVADYMQEDVKDIQQAGLRAKLINFFLADSLMADLSYYYGDSFKGHIANFENECANKLKVCNNEITHGFDLTVENIAYLERELEMQIKRAMYRKPHGKKQDVKLNLANVKKLCKAIDVCYGDGDFENCFFYFNRAEARYEMRQVVEILCKASALKSQHLLNSYKNEVNFADPMQTLMYAYCLVTFISELNLTYGEMYRQSFALCYDNLNEEGSIIAQICEFEPPG